MEKQGIAGMPMLQNLEASQRRFGGKDEAIDRWLESRKTLLVQFLGLTQNRAQPGALPKREQLTDFFDALVDYVSAGHFEIYEELLEKAEHCGSEAVALAKELFPQFSASTDLALAFTDRYADAGDEEMVNHFDRDLARLGSDLTGRFELEDRLIGALCEAQGAAA